MLSITLIICNICISQAIDDQANVTIDRIEEAFKKRTIIKVQPYLTDGFTINDNSPSFSKQMLAGLIIELPIKKIKARQVISTTEKEITIGCKMVIAKYLGIFSQPIELTLLKENGSFMIHHMLITGQDGEGVGVTVEVDEGAATNEKAIRLEDLSKIESKGAITYYENGLHDDAVDINSTQIKGLGIAKNILGEDILFKMGFLLLKDTMANMSIDEAVIPVPLDDNSVEGQEFSGTIVNWVYFHEVTELHLLLGRGILDPKTRWFRDGLADYIAHSVAKQLNPEIDSLVMTERMEAYEKVKGNAQLLNWIGTGSEKKQSGIEGGSGQYAAAMLFFIDLTNKYGEDIIHKLLDAISDVKNITSKVLVRELTGLTGANIKSMIESY